MELGWARWAALVTPVLLAACVSGPPSEQVRSSFSAMFECDSAQVQVAIRSGGYAVNGCQRVAFYKCDGQDCRLGSEPVKEEGAEPRWLRLTLSGGAELRLKATPEATDKVELIVDSTSGSACELGLMIDGQRLELPHGESKASLMLSRDVMIDLGGASQVALRACDSRWSLGSEDLEDVRKFARDYLEELAWKDEPRQGSSGGRKPPADGWKPWQQLSAFPSAAPPDAQLSGTQLFEKLSPSIVRVEGKQADGSSLGSAVAVSSSQLLTNCHVVAGCAQDHRQTRPERMAREAREQRARQRSLRARGGGGAVRTRAGGRAYVDLKVGETLYTLGNPSGLDLTLANGILSALREEGGVRYVQTTAPISPGSSGGGLFDARGNLVGITTLAIVGKERLNQSLNFAIAAEMFWSP
jgi:hypothetical protein